MQSLNVGGQGIWRADSGEVNLPGGKLLKSVAVGWIPALKNSAIFHNAASWGSPIITR